MTFPAGARVHWRETRLGRHPHLRSGCADCVPRRLGAGDVPNTLMKSNLVRSSVFSGVSFLGQILIGKIYVFFMFFFPISHMFPTCFRGLDLDVQVWHSGSSLPHDPTATLQHSTRAGPWPTFHGDHGHAVGV